MIRTLSLAILLCGFPLLASGQSRGAGPGDESPARAPLALKGAKVSSEDRAKELAWKAYVDHSMKTIGVSRYEFIGGIAIVDIGFEIPGFAKERDRVWEVRILDTFRGLRAIVWIHPGTEEVRFIVTPEK